tara:strand:- start:1287 stop:2048 length:762 start_codon:yes stop_codon:yes gene_type:complete
MHHSARRLLSLGKINKCTSYLEIGVHTGKTFSKLDFNTMHGVDPEFKFDITKSNRDGTEFFQMNSDKFFYQTSKKNKYDLFFLDGLHTYDQTYRDFCNCLSCSNQKSIILIDDILPSDSYAAMRNQNFAMNLRIAESPSYDGKINYAWMGDVFKILYFINLFNSNLEYATISNNGNPQTVVWKESPSIVNKDYIKKKPYKKLNNYHFILQSIENLNKASFERTMNYCPEIYQFAKEEDILNYLEKIFSYEAYN